MTIALRLATTDDIPWLLEQLHEFDTFYGSSRSLFPPTIEETEHKLTFLIEQHLFVIAYSERGPAGFLAAFRGDDFLSGRPRINELFWWVSEAYRGSRAAMLLYNHFIGVARSEGREAVYSRLPHSPLSPDFFRSRGFVEKETSWLLEAP